MKKLSLLLTLCIGICNTMQPAAAPNESAQGAKSSNESLQVNESAQDCVVWTPWSEKVTQELPNEAWRKIIAFVGAENIQKKLFKQGIKKSSIHAIVTKPAKYTSSIFIVPNSGEVKQVHVNRPAMNELMVSDFGINIYLLPKVADPIFPHDRIKIMKGHTAKIYWEDASPDCRQIATASADKTVKIWDLETGQKLRTLKGHKAEVNCVKYSPNGKHIASASDDETVKVWDAKTGKEIIALRNGNGPFSDVAFSSPLTGEPTWDGDGPVFDVAFSPDGNEISSHAWSGNFGHSVRKLWNISMLNHKFNSDQVQVLHLLNEHAQQRNPLVPFSLSDIEAKNERARAFGLQSKFEDLFPREIRDNIVDTYKIADWICLPEPEDCVTLYEQEIQQQEKEKQRQLLFNEKQRLAQQRKKMLITRSDDRRTIAQNKARCKKSLERLEQFAEQQQVDRKKIIGKRKNIALIGAGALAIASATAWYKWKS